MQKIQTGIKIIGLFIISSFITFSLFAQTGQGISNEQADSFNNHRVVLDGQSKIISWITPQSKAYDQFLKQRWDFIKTLKTYSPGPAPRSSYPPYYFYCAYRYKDGVLEPDTWMNDIGEKIPNWFESARLYYAYTGDTEVMELVKKMVDYTMQHGTSAANFSWPGFPYTTTNAGDTIFRGFTSAKRFALHEIQVDHAGEMGLTYYRMYQYTSDDKYKKAAIQVANVLAAKVKTGSATQSPWPYRVIMKTGKVTSPYGANWIGCYELLDNLANANLGNVIAYRAACKKVKDFMLNYPMKTGYWTDGHSDTDVNSNTYKSNLSASNTALYLSDHHEFDPNWKTSLPMLIAWTEKYFVFRSAPGETGTQWGANIVGEQDSFMYKMDYQTARYAAQCARWYSFSGDDTYKDKAFRSLNWVTYCNDSTGMASESPMSKGISNWWSDCYGEGPRMFYHALAAVPEWAPPAENHILFSTAVLKNVSYGTTKISYSATGIKGTDYIRTAFEPTLVKLNGQKIEKQSTLNNQGYTIKKLQEEGWAITINRLIAGDVEISN
ncbi:MAG: hypothetical protein ABIQ31_23275 [Ferruginibacter sp.]